MNFRNFSMTTLSAGAGTGRYKKGTINAACALALASLSMLAPTAAAQDTDNGDVKFDPALAENHPDEFNWSVLAAICKRAPDSLQFTFHGQKTNNAVMETWADDPFTFPGQNHSAPPDPANPPKWENRNKSVSVEPIIQQTIRQLRLAHSTKPALKLFLIPTSGGEVSYRNKAGFQYIIDNGLFYQEGVAAAVNKGINSDGYPNGTKVNFPINALEIKAVYEPLAAPYTFDNCHWNYGQDGKPYALVALHIMSKQVPNWTWATWEWSGNTPDQPNGNPGRSDWYGSRDAFGTTYKNAAGAQIGFQAPVVDEQGNPSGKPYPSGTLTPALLKMFKDAGYSDEWTHEWSNYRLKGSQLEPTDATGVTTLVGNSVTEKGFVQTASCITCHANASFDSKGVFNQSVGFTEDGQSRNGPLDPGWFYDMNTYDPTQPFGTYKVKYYPVDFVWAIFRAQPKKS